MGKDQKISLGNIRSFFQENIRILLTILILSTLFTQCTAEPNGTTEDWYKKGVDLTKKNLFNDAIAAFDKSIEINQSNIDAWIGKGNGYQNLKKYSEAISAYNSSLSIDNRSVKAWTGKGNSLNSLNQYEEALLAFNTVIEINNNSSSGYLSKAGTLQKLKRYQEAVDAYDKAIELDKKTLSAYFGKATSLQSLNKDSEAIEVYDQAIEINASNIQSYTGKAGVYVKQKRFNEALNVYDKAVTIDPAAIWAWSGKGSVLLSLKQYEEAISAYDHVISLNESYAPAWRSKAGALIPLKRSTEAMKALDQALGYDPGFFGAWMDKGNLLINLNQSKEAIVAFDQAISLNQSDASAWNAKGKALMNLEKYSDSITAFEKALQLKPDLIDAQKNKEQVQFKIFQATNGTSIPSQKPVSEVTAGISASQSEQLTQSSTFESQSWLSTILGFIFGKTQTSAQNIMPSTDMNTNDFPDRVNLIAPVAISFNSDAIFIADAGNRSVIRTDLNGSINLIIKNKAGQPDLFTELTSVTSDEKGNIYVLDAGANKIFLFDNSGKLMRSWGTVGSDPGQFIHPTQIICSKIPGSQNPVLFVTDSGNKRIQVFDVDGTYLKTITMVKRSSGSSQNSNNQIMRELSSNNGQYTNIIPDEQANPPELERNYNIHIKDSQPPISMNINRGMYLGAQKNSDINIDINANNPEIWENILKGTLNDPVTIDTINKTLTQLEIVSRDTKLSDSESLDLISNFIQQIPLVTDSEHRYPIEVLYDKKASSSDKALFLYGLLYNAGYDVVFISYPGTTHCAVGILSVKTINKPAIKEYILNNKTYIYLNPDNPDFIGRINPSFLEVDPVMMHILPQDAMHSKTLPELENKLYILETLETVGKKKTFLEGNVSKFSSSAQKLVKSDLSKIKTVLDYVEANIWNSEGVTMRLKNSKVDEIQFNYGMA